MFDRYLSIVKDYLPEIILRKLKQLLQRIFLIDDAFWTHHNYWLPNNNSRMHQLGCSLFLMTSKIHFILEIITWMKQSFPVFKQIERKFKIPKVSLENYFQKLTTDLPNSEKLLSYKSLKVNPVIIALQLRDESAASKKSCTYFRPFSIFFRLYFIY